MPLWVVIDTERLIFHRLIFLEIFLDIGLAKLQTILSALVMPKDGTKFLSVNVIDHGDFSSFLAPSNKLVNGRRINSLHHIPNSWAY